MVEGYGLTHLDNTVLIINYGIESDHLNSTYYWHFLRLKEVSFSKAVYVADYFHNYSGADAYWGGIATPETTPRSYLVKF